VLGLNPEICGDTHGLARLLVDDCKWKRIFRVRERYQKAIKIVSAMKGARAQISPHGIAFRALYAAEQCISVRRRVERAHIHNIPG
jgi:hypothetical protein